MGFSSAGIGVFWVAAMGFSGVGIGVFVVVAMGVFECRHLGFFVVTALVFLWVAASGLAEVSTQAPVVFSERIQQV